MCEGSNPPASFQGQTSYHYSHKCGGQETKSKLGGWKRKPWRDGGMKSYFCWSEERNGNSLVDAFILLLLLLLLFLWELCPLLCPLSVVRCCDKGMFCRERLKSSFLVIFKIFISYIFTKNFIKVHQVVRKTQRCLGNINFFRQFFELFDRFLSPKNNDVRV